MAKRARTGKATKRKAAPGKAVKKAAKKAAAKKATVKKAAKKAARKTPKKAARRAAKKVTRKAAARKPPPKKAAAKRSPKKAAPKKAVTRAAKKAAPPKAAPKKRTARPKRARRPAPIRGPIPSSLSVVGSGSSSARSGRADLVERLQNHRESGPAITAGDLDANWEVAYSSGDEAPGGDNPTPDQDVVDEIGHALGIEYNDDEELKGALKVEERDRHRWELDPASAEDYPDHEN